MRIGSGEPRRLPTRSRISVAGAYLIVIFGCAKINQFTMSGFLTDGASTVVHGSASPVRASGVLTGWGALLGRHHRSTIRAGVPPGGRGADPMGAYY